MRCHQWWNALLPWPRFGYVQQCKGRGRAPAFCEGKEGHSARVLLHVFDISALAVQAFCWLCGHATGYQHTWSEIDNHSCGRYREEADKRIDQAQRNNQRYQHYCLRWCVRGTTADYNFPTFQQQ